MNVLTGNYPAEFGRKLGGVIDVVTARASSPGFHGKAALQGGSFATESGYLSGQYVFGPHYGQRELRRAPYRAVSRSAGRAELHQQASGADATVRLERDLNDKDRLSLYAQRKRVGFLVPNEKVQEQAGQREDRSSEETARPALLPTRLLAAAAGIGPRHGARRFGRRSGRTRFRRPSCRAGSRISGILCASLRIRP